MIQPDKYIELVECGCCCQYHLPGYTGDCRDDAQRFPTYQVYVGDYHGRPAYLVDDGADADKPELFRYVDEDATAMRRRLAERDWPTNADGSPKRMGDMTKAERKAQAKAALERLRPALESPEFHAAVKKHLGE